MTGQLDLARPAPDATEPLPRQRLDDTDLDDRPGNIHLDFVEQGAPLIITFGFWDAEVARFEFLGRLRKVEQVSGRPLNKLLVRDPSMRWYLGGIDGVGTDVASTVDNLRRHIDALQPSAVVTIGQSMGAYAATLYGTLLGVDKIIAFGTLSAFDRRIWSLLHDTRWITVLDEVEASGLDFDAYRDLPAVLRAAPGPLPEIDLIFGLSPGPGTILFHAIGHDGAHAIRFSEFPDVAILPIPHSPHAVVEHFRAQGAITAVLQQRLFGTSLLPLMREISQEPWCAWLLQNTSMGASFEQLRPVMIEAGQPPHEVDIHLLRTKLLTELGHLEDHPPRTTI